MSIVVPNSVDELRSTLRGITDHTRPPIDAEILAALNYGRGEVVRAIRSVRPQFFRGVVNPFSLTAGQQEYDIGAIEPPIWRPVRLHVPGQRPIRFRYRAEMDEEFEEREVTAASHFTTVLYDVVSGLLPLVGTTSTASGSTSTVTVASPTPFAIGQIIAIPGSGPNQAIAGTLTTIPTTYYGIVTGIAGSVLTVAPPMTLQPSNGTVVQPYSRLILKLANAPANSVTGRLEYQFAQPKWKSFTEMLDPMMSEHQDAIIYFAASVYLRAVNDQEARTWLEHAQLLKSQLMQDLEPLSGQNSEALGTDLSGLY